MLGDELSVAIESSRAAFEERFGDLVPGSPVVPELNITFDFLVASGDVIGVRLARYEFAGAGGAESARSLWFDTSGDRALPATALLDGPGALEQVANYARVALQRDRPDLSLPDQLEAGTAATDENYNSIGFTATGDLLIEFDEYQVGPGSSGSPRVLIPAASAALLLSDFGRRAQEQVLDPSGALALPEPAPTSTPTHEAARPPVGGVDCAQVACVALTFDDGPARPTSRLLDILAERGSHATFFVVGVNATHNEELLARIVAEGHEVGNHALDHRDLTKLSAEQVREQVEGAAQAIEAVTGVRPRLLRPPYGALDERVAEVTGMPFILWSVDPRDWADHDTALVAQRVASQAHRGSIVLLHDIHTTTVDAVPAILDDFAARGLTAVTVTDLLGPELVAGRSYRSQFQSKQPATRNQQ